MRPTGRLHLGHLIGALGNWVPMQDQYDCFYFVADWHALTSDFADTSQLTSYAYENVADWIGAGLDPEKSTFFVQSFVPEHAELYLLLSMVVPVPSPYTTPRSFPSAKTRWRTSSSRARWCAGSTMFSARS
jgi:tryptophanyl-tRNA synthetase